MDESLAVAVFARGGSKGIPGKNLATVGSETLIARAIRHGFEIGATEVFVSTDSSDLADEATRCGASVPFLRPQDLAADSSAEWLAWRHLAVYLAGQYPSTFARMLILPATAPLRATEDVQGVIAMIGSGEWDVVVTMSEAHRHPRFNVVRMSENYTVELYDRDNTPVVRRQDVGEVYDLTTVAYGVGIDYLLASNSMWDGRVGGWVVPQERALDIDTPFDLEVARLLIDKGKSDGR